MTGRSPVGRLLHWIRRSRSEQESIVCHLFPLAFSAMMACKSRSLPRISKRDTASVCLIPPLPVREPSQNRRVRERPSAQAFSLSCRCLCVPKTPLTQIPLCVFEIGLAASLRHFLYRDKTPLRILLRHRANVFELQTDSPFRQVPPEIAGAGSVQNPRDEANTVTSSTQLPPRQRILRAAEIVPSACTDITLTPTRFRVPTSCPSTRMFSLPRRKLRQESNTSCTRVRRKPTRERRVHSLHCSHGRSLKSGKCDATT